MSQESGGVLQVLAEGFQAPLVALCVAVGAAIAFAGRPTPPPPPPPGVATSTAVPPGPAATEAHVPDVGPEDGEVPARQATPQELQALIAQGSFERAEAWARASRQDVLADRAALLEGLTRGIAVGPFGDGSQVLRVTGTDGERFLAVLKAETGDRLTLVLRDGKDRAMARAQVRQREALAPEAARRALEEGLKAERAALGAEAPGLSIYPLARQSFACGLRTLGTQLMLEALRTPEGQILVDMFAEGDPDRMHAARRKLLAEPTTPAPATGGPVASLPRDGGSRTRPPRPRDPEPEPEPEPDEEPEPEPEEEPPPRPLEREPDRPDTVTESRRNAGDEVLDHPKWRSADSAYRMGLQLYRTSFDRSVSSAAPSVRAALNQFRQAQDLLIALGREVPGAADSYEVERRLVEINSLVLDCTKRLGTDD